MKCPNCSSTDINLETGICRNCGERVDAAPATPEEREGAALLQSIEQASAAIEVAQTEEERRAAYQAWEERVFHYYEQGFRIITLIGFSEAGKTFLAHRLRYELADDWNVFPHHEDEIPRTGITIELTQLVRKQARPRRRVIADCDGEAYKSIVQAAVHRQDIDMNMRRAILIAALASAYILVLPAAELIDRKAHKGTQLLTQRFGAIVQLIMALQRIVATAGGPRGALRGGLRLDAVAEALQHEYRCEQPIHVLFSQADKLPRDQKYADDPHMFALTYAKTLYRSIESNFTNFRFDFVCAFDGHPESGTFEVDYDLPCYGTVAAFNWIDTMLDASPRERRRTAEALKIRRRFDAAFRKMAARVPG